MDKNEIKKLHELDITTPIYELGQAFRSSTANVVDAIYAGAYVLLKANERKGIVLDSFESFIQTCKLPPDRVLFLQQSLEKSWDSLIELSQKINEDELKAILLFFEPNSARNGFESTPDGITQLALNLLDIKAGDRVADFGTGLGSFLREAYTYEPNAQYCGIEINVERKEIAGIRAELLGNNVHIELGNILDTQKHSREFDVAFANYPFGSRMNGMLHQSKTLSTSFENAAFAKTASSMDWVYNAAVYNSIAGPRRAVCIMTNGSTWNMLDKNARRHFLLNGTIETVIALPERIFDYTNMATTMIVFSHGNTSVMMVDARNLCEKGRRLNVITDDFVEKIAHCCKEESKYSKRVSSSEIEENNCILNPARYLDREEILLDGIPFASVIRNITRGAQLKASELDEMASEKATDTQYLMQGDIQDGIIDENLHYLTALDKRLEKYCIKSGDLILSKNGAPFKIAVAEVREGQKILANGNLYVIELDTEKADPYFVKAFLESDTGEATLRSITVGAIIPNIGVEQLKRIKIPARPLDEQKKIALRYRAKMDEVRMLRRKLEKTRDSLKHLFDMSEEG